MKYFRTGGASYCLLLTSCCFSISILLLLRPLGCAAQDTVQRYVRVVDEKINTFNGRVDRYTVRTLDKLIRQERKMRSKVASRDSGMARRLFDYSIDSLQRFKSMVQGKAAAVKYAGQQYFPYLDTLKQSLSFLNKGTGLNGVTELEGRLAIAGKLNEYLDQRQSVIQSAIKDLPGLTGNLTRLKKDAYYYRSQVEEYKSSLQDPDKIEKMVVGALQRTAAFRQFMEQHSQLAGLFAPSGAFSPGGSAATGVNGLASRASVQQALQASLPAGGPKATQMVQQQVGTASAALNPEKSSGDEVDFTPNTQHTRPFLKRLEFGTDMQFGSPTNFLPATGDFSLQVGYKVNDNASFGVGAAYKLGLGNGWGKINFSNEGAGLRTYIKWRLKGSYYIQGGAEWNYLSRYGPIPQLGSYNAWQQSALLGLSKKYKVGRKFNGNVQLLYDFLCREHIPASRPVLFRVGYNF